MELIERLRVLKYLVEENVNIHEGLNGCRINLSKLNADEIEGLEQFVENLKNMNMLEPKYVIE